MSLRDAVPSQGSSSGRSLPLPPALRPSRRPTPCRKPGEPGGQAQLVLSLDLGWISLPAADSSIIRQRQSGTSWGTELQHLPTGHYRKLPVFQITPDLAAAGSTELHLLSSGRRGTEAPAKRCPCCRPWGCPEEQTPQRPPRTNVRAAELLARGVLCRLAGQWPRSRGLEGAAALPGAGAAPGDHMCPVALGRGPQASRRGPTAPLSPCPVGAESGAGARLRSQIRAFGRRGVSNVRKAATPTSLLAD